MGKHEKTEEIFLLMRKGNKNMGLIRVFEDYYLNYKSGKTNRQEIYYIAINGNMPGFFALLRAAIDGCCYAVENGFLPYIKYSRNVLYAEDFFFMGTNNPFEYYFEQPLNIKRFIDLKRAGIVKKQQIHIDSIELKYNLKLPSYLMEETYIIRMSEIYKI